MVQLVDPSRSNQFQTPQSGVSRPDKANIESPPKIRQEERQDILNVICHYSELGNEKTKSKAQELLCLKVKGDHLVTGSSFYSKYEGTCRIWDLNTFQCVKELNGHTAPVSCVEVHEGRIYTGSFDKTCRIWDLKTGNCLAVLSGHAHIVGCIKKVHGKLITGSWDGTFKVWDLNTFKCLHTLGKFSRPIQYLDANDDIVVALSYSPSKDFNSTREDSDKVEIYTDSINQGNDNIPCHGIKGYSWQAWNIHTGKCLHVFKDDTSDAPRHIRILQNELIIAGKNTCEIWDLKSLKCKISFQPRMESINVMEVKDSLVIFAENDKWKSYDRDTGKEVLASEEQKDHRILGLRIENGMVITGQAGREVTKFWDLKTGKCLQTLKPSDSSRCYSSEYFHLDYKDGRLLITGGYEAPIVWDIRVLQNKFAERKAIELNKEPEDVNQYNGFLKQLVDKLTEEQENNNDLPALLKDFSKLPSKVRKEISAQFFKQMVSSFLTDEPDEKDLQWAEDVFCNPLKNTPEINRRRASAILDYLIEMDT